MFKVSLPLYAMFNVWRQMNHDGVNCNATLSKLLDEHECLSHGAITTNGWATDQCSMQFLGFVCNRWCNRFGGASMAKRDSQWVEGNYLHLSCHSEVHSTPSLRALPPATQLEFQALSLLFRVLVSLLRVGALPAIELPTGVRSFMLLAILIWEL